MCIVSLEQSAYKFGSDIGFELCDYLNIPHHVYSNMSKMKNCSRDFNFAF